MSTIIVLKMEQFCFTRWNGEQCRPRSDCSLGSSLIRVCTVCQVLSVQMPVYMISVINTGFYILQSTINIIFDRVGKVDPVTRGIEIAVNYLGIQFDVSILKI